MKKIVKVIVVAMVMVSLLTGCCREEYKIEDCPYCDGLGYYTCDGCGGTYDCYHCE